MAFDPNELLATYLGAGSAGGYQPIGCDDRLKAAHPRDFEAALASITKYLDGCEYPPTEWTSNDLAKEQAIYAAKVSRAFPELKPRSTNALACRWAYGWR